MAAYCNSSIQACWIASRIRFAATRGIVVEERGPLVVGEPHVRFYAGVPLVSEEGLPLGTLAVADTLPRPAGLSDFQREGLAVMAQSVMRRMRSRRHSRAARLVLADR